MENKINLDRQTKFKINKLYSEGYSIKKIAKLLNLSEWAVRKNRDKRVSDASLLYHHNSRWKLNKAQLKFLCKHGFTAVETAQILKTDAGNIYGAQKRLSINFIKESEKRKLRIEELIDKGLTATEISKKLNISTTCVYAATNKRPGIKNKYRKCSICGKTFIATTSQQKFCCKKCEKESNYNLNNVKRRARERNAIVDKDITLKKVYEQENGICYICGKQCDWEDYTVSTDGRKHARRSYPTIDHIKPLSKGGKHEWNNVRLAHLGCNASKGVGE